MKGYEAIKLAIEDNKEIRRNKPTWADDHAIYYDGNYFKYTHLGTRFHFEDADYDANDWEIYIEKPRVGDWIVCRNGRDLNISGGRKFDIVSSIKGDLFYFADDNCAINISEIRKATEDEIKNELNRRKWAEWKREVNEYKAGDVFMEKGDTSVCWTVYEVFETGVRDDDRDAYNFDEIHMVCPVERRVDLQ